MHTLNISDSTYSPFPPAAHNIATERCSCFQGRRIYLLWRRRSMLLLITCAGSRGC